jgi:hypothetical protein
VSAPGLEAMKERVREVKSRIEAAARRAGRDPAAVTLIGASKTVDPELVRAALAAGVEIFGENRVQEAERKISAAPGGRWHLIGHLQRNKARRAVELFEMIQSLDSVRLAEVLDRIGQERGRPVDALVEVNLGGEATKSGFDPAELSFALDELAGRPGLRILGLMTIPPFFDDPTLSRPFFRRLRELAHEYSRRGLPGASFGHLSMGMSGDYEVAVEEGATFVRIGTALFGGRS